MEWKRGASSWVSAPGINHTAAPPFTLTGIRVSVHRGKRQNSLARNARREPAQLQQTIVVSPARQVIQRIAQEMHVAALPVRLHQHLAIACFESRMIIADDQHHASSVRAPSGPSRNSFQLLAALALASSTANTLATAFPVDAQRDQSLRATADDPVLAHLLVARIQNQIRILLVQLPLRPTSANSAVEFLVDLADRCQALNSWPHNSSVMALTLRVADPEDCGQATRRRAS